MVRVAGVAQVEIKQLGLEHPPAPGSIRGCTPRERPHPLLVNHHMRLLVHEHLVAWPGVGARRDQVPHGTGGDVHGGFLAEHRRDLRLQRDHRGIVTPDIVADLGLAIARRISGVGRVTVSERKSSVGTAAAYPARPGSNR